LRKFLLCTLLVLLMTGLTVGTVSAADISVYVDGSKLTCDVPPAIKDGRALVPLRVIFDALGAQVQYQAETKTVTAEKAGIVVKLTIGSSTAYRNQEQIRLDVSAQVINGRTLVPLRFVSQALGAKVQWDAGTRTITITSSGGSDKSGPGKKDLTVTFIDVGQGDAILVRSLNGSTMLIDAGPPTYGQKIVNYLKKAGISSIDIFVVTHPHADHIGGALDVLNNFDVGKVYDPAYPHTSKTYENFLLAIDRKNIDYKVARRGGTIPFDDSVSVRILHPGKVMDDGNNSSIVLKLDYGSVSFVFAGDAEVEAEQEILRHYNSIPAEVLKVGHHGSSTSTSSAFLSAVSPDYAVIMVGVDNPYGHPHSETLSKLKAAGVKVYRTDLHGTVILKTDGSTISITTEKQASTAASPSTVTQPAAGEQPSAGTGMYVGSIKSDKYHLPTCRYAEIILPENRIWFDSRAEAEAYGYIPCGVCRP